jgi:DNA-binding YbaB/EbfC family protein
MKMPRGSMPGMGGMPNMNNMLKQAQKMQQEMQKIQEEIDKMEFEVSVGGGAINVKITGKKEIKEIALKPEVVDPDDIEMLSDLLVAAVNEAIRKADEASSAAMKKVTGGMGMPGMF